MGPSFLSPFRWCGGKGGKRFGSRQQKTEHPPPSSRRRAGFMLLSRPTVGVSRDLACPALESCLPRMPIGCCHNDSGTCLITYISERRMA
jgi:hypothetical protein